jgi:hypothetical protein
MLKLNMPELLFKLWFITITVPLAQEVELGSIKYLVQNRYVIAKEFQNLC